MEVRPSNRLYGVTHDPTTGEPRVVEPRTTKVGIGLSKGKALHAYIDAEDQWVVMLGSGKDAVRKRFQDKRSAQLYYRTSARSAPERKYPERLPYFTFSRLAANGDMEPDWDVIADHGPMPTEIDIIFLRDDPFTAAYQLWGASEKKCQGDGKVALRVLSMAKTPAENQAAAAAEKRGEKYFPVDTCWLSGCPYSKPSDTRPSPCRPMGHMVFQLIKSPRLGGSATFNTSGYKSISQLFSSIEIFKRATGSGNAESGFVAGIPLKLVLRPYRVLHAGKPATQYAVSLEFRAASALALKRDLIEEAVKFRLAGAEPLRQLEAGTMPLAAPEIPDLPAAAIAAEFDIEPAETGGEDSPNNDDCPDDSALDLEHSWDDEDRTSEEHSGQRGLL